MEIVGRCCNTLHITPKDNHRKLPPKRRCLSLSVKRIPEEEGKLTAMLLFDLLPYDVTSGPEE